LSIASGALGGARQNAPALARGCALDGGAAVEQGLSEETGSLSLVLPKSAPLGWARTRQPQRTAPPRPCV